MTASHALSQLSYTPERLFRLGFALGTVISIAGSNGIVNTYFSFFSIFFKGLF